MNLSTIGTLDEKPGVQALALTAPDLPPVPGEYPTVGRDYEYKRMGTASILAGLDLQDGHVTARVERRHRSREFVQLLKELDARYPAEAVIRLILDNHSAHISKETRAYLGYRSSDESAQAESGQYVSSLSAADVLAWYRRELPVRGWAERTQDSSPALAVFGKSGHLLSVAVQTLGEKGAAVFVNETAGGER